MVDRLARALFDMGRDVTARDVKGRTPSRPSSQVSSLLPPPPRLSLSNVLDTATSQVNRAVATPPQQNQPQRLNIPTVTERREEPDAWGVYETNYGPVAMPASWGEAAGYRQQGDLITDPQQLERAKNSNYAYTKLPEEQQREIRMPVLEGRADNAVREVTGSVSGGIAPFIRDEAKKQIDAASRIGSGAVTGGIEKALKIRDELPEREESQDEQAFAVVRNNQTNSTHLVRREDLEAAPEGTFTVITPNVNAQEAQSMMDAGLLQEGEAPVIRGPEDMGGEVVDPGEQASLAQSVLRQQQQEAERQAQEEAEAEQRRQEAVVEINGHLFPAGTTAPGQYTLENIDSAPMPEGYVWVTDIGGDNPYLVPVQRDDTGQLIAPEGTVLVAGTAPATTQSENYPDWLKELRSDPNMVIGGYLEQGGEWVMDAAGWVNDTVSGIVPQNFKDWWNENVEKPLDIAIRSGALDGVAREFESIPIVGPIISGILRNPTNQQLMQSFADNPLSGIIQIIAAPQQALVVNVVDHEINKILGREDSGFSDSAGQVGSVVFENAPFLRFITEDLQVWIRQNPDEAVDLYENGYDVDDDGTPDLYGGDAVYQYWMDNETPEGAAGIFYRLIFETGSDPLTWAAGAGALGRGVNLLGRGIRMADNAGPIRRTVGGLTEGVGTAIHVAGRTGEVIGDFGAEYVLQGATWVLRKSKIIGESPAARREADMTDFEEATEGATRQEKVVSEGDTITLDENGNAVEIEHADGSTTTIDGPQRPPAPEGVETGTVLEQDYYNTRIVRGEDTWEVQVLNNDGQWVTRTKSKSLDNARKWETRYQQRATTASGGGRWERAAPESNSQKFIDQIPQEQYDALRAALGDQWAQSEDIMASIGRGNPLPEHALESSRIARVTIDTAEDIAQGQPLPEWGLNTAHYVGAPYYEAMETAIRRPWSDPEAAASRAMLSGQGTVTRSDGLRVQARTPIISSDPLPRGRLRVSQKQIRAANNYVDMMHEHAKWHPESFRDSSFNEAWQRAVDLDYALRQRGQRRSYNGVEREPLTAVRVPDGMMFTPEVQRGAARVTNEPGPSPQRAAEPEGESWTIEDPDSPRNNGRGYRITEDIWIEVTPVNASDVPTQWLRTYPDHRGRWYAAIVKGDNHTAESLIVTYAPTEAEALGLARETLAARGLIPADAPATPDRSGEPEVWPNQPTRNDPNRPLGAENPPDPIYKGLYDRAKAAPSKEDGLRIFREYAEGKYGPRSESVRQGQRTNRAGKVIEGQGEVYEATREGRGWRTLDRLMEGFARDWDDLRGASRVDAPTPRDVVARGLIPGEAPTPQGAAPEPPSGTPYKAKTTDTFDELMRDPDIRALIDDVTDPYKPVAPGKYQLGEPAKYLFIGNGHKLNPGPKHDYFTVDTTRLGWDRQFPFSFTEKADLTAFVNKVNPEAHRIARQRYDAAVAAGAKKGDTVTDRSTAPGRLDEVRPPVTQAAPAPQPQSPRRQPRDVVAEINAGARDVVRMRTGPEQPRPHLTSRGLPKVGEGRTWNDIPVRAVDIDGETVYIFDTNDGPFAIRRENGKAVAVDPAAATEGRLVELTWDGGRAINMRDAGRHIFRMHEQAATPDVPAGDAVRAADAPETVDTTPDTPAPAEAPTGAARPRMTPETRRQRVQRIRSSRKRQMREVRQNREAVVNARVRALYGEVTPEGGLRADVLAPPVRRFDPPEATTPDPSGTFEMPRGETPDPEGRPAWADPNVPEIAPEAEKAVMRGARRGGGSIPADPGGARGGAHRIRKKVIVKPGQGKKASLATNHFVQEQGVTGKAAAPERQYWMGHPMTDDYVDALTRHTFPEGDTPLERIPTRAERYAANDNYRQDMSVYEWRAIQDTKADYAKLLAEVHQNWGARQVRKGVAKLPEPARKALEAFGRALRGVLGVWDSITTFRRERMLFSHERALAYPSMQYFGNAAQLAAGGKFYELFKGANPRNINRYRKQLLRQATTVEEAILLDPASTNYMKLQVQVGAPIPREVRDIYQGMLNNLNDPLELERWLKAVNPQLGKLGKLSGSKKYALWGGAIDASFRDAVGHGKMVRTLRDDAIPDFRNQTQMRLMDWGLSREEARQLWREFTDSYDGPFFDSNRVRQFFEPHVGEGRAVRLQRDWQGAVNKADKIAREDIRKFTFASPRTNADEVLGRLFLFHHFMTRQSNYYANLVARHPAMLNLYFNIEEELRNEDWPDFLDGWVPSFTIFGRQFFLNPTYVFSSYLFFNDRQSFEEENVTGAGRVLNWFNDIVGVNAIIMDVANLTGVLGDTNAPDIFGFRRETNTLTTLFNWGRAHGIIGDDPTPVANPELQFSFNLRERLSGWLPGTEEIRAIDVEARMDREVNMLVVDELQREDPDFDIETPEGQERFIEVTSDPENEIYQRALKRYVNGEVAEIVTRFFAGPLAPRNRMVNEDGEDLYHSFSRDVKNIVNVSDPRVHELNLQADRYYDIGTERDREIAGLWNQVAFGNVHHPITVDGVTYSPAEIYHMNTEQRIALADGLLQEHGLLDDYKELQDERDRFLAQPENAEYAQFYTWRKEVNDYDGGVEQYWQDAIDGGNESARLYYEDVMSQPLTYEQRHQRLTSMYGFMQLKGYHTSVWDPAPVQMHGVFDPVNVANQVPQPIPYEEPNAEFRNEVRKAPEQLAELQEWDNKVKQVQSEMGIDPSIPFNELDTQTRIAIEDELEARGHKEPSLSWQVKKYVEWAEQQPPGADTSIEAFFEASDREYREGAPGRVQEKMNKPEPAPGPDRYGNQPTSSPSLWAEIDALLREHDHRYKPDDEGSSSGSPGSGHWLLPYIN